MKVRLETIGKSKVVRLPETVIRDCGLGDMLELRVENGAVVLTPCRGVREGWDAAFERMAASGDDAPLIPDTLDNDFDTKAWSW
ncbi:AbrB/MazE/SpoVT family DNA-binding domain-containing protein [Fodinicurvata fenggangensis]|uniref:AbrB/MazE/SpoVT family DNA-binding domain-containing protein n=1 Tax=Fodinicurvata fenggangensis TaxID=1121830 RepID=UPI000478C529|nr:AbrB/MazE/SpoVT family DNA-binding domain-containing protein [Fodinicurvata fenggangensis]